MINNYNYILITINEMFITTEWSTDSGNNSAWAKCHGMHYSSYLRVVLFHNF